MRKDREQYTMGYGPAATAMMATRTAQGHAAFFLPHLTPDMRLLDCGCGPGTISLGFAEVVAPGHVVGTEIEASQVALAREQAATRHVANASFISTRCPLRTPALMPSSSLPSAGTSRTPSGGFVKRITS